MSSTTSNLTGYVEVVQTGTRFNNTVRGDLAIYTDSNSQAIELGVVQTSNSILKISNNTFATNFSVLTTGSNSMALSNIRDVSSNWSTLSNVGAFTLCNIAPLGSSNGAIDLNNGYFVFSSNTLPAFSNIAHSNILSTDFTIESWVHFYARPPLVFASYTPYLIGNYKVTSTDNYWSFGVNCNMQLGFFTNHSIGAGVVYTPSNTVPLNTWAHIAMSYSNAPKTIKFYVNGVALSNLTASNATGIIYSVANSSATEASGSGITSILNPAIGFLLLGRYGGSNSPCYIHDFKFVTGTCYAPSNPPPFATSVTTGTQLLLRATHVLQTPYTPLVTQPNGFLGIGGSNPAYQMDVSGSANVSGYVRSSNPYYWSHLSNYGITNLKNAVMNFNSNPITNVPSAYVNGVFTVPVNGTYFISVAGVLGTGSGQAGGGIGNVFIRKNASTVTRGYWQCNSFWENVNVHYVAPLVRNDKIDIYADSGGGIYASAGDPSGGYGTFAIFMLG